MSTIPQNNQDLKRKCNYLFSSFTACVRACVVLVIQKQLVLPTYHIYSSAAPLCCNASGICRLCIVGSLLPFYGDCLGKEDIPWDPRAMNGKNLARERTLTWTWTHLSTYLSVYLSIYLSLYLSIYISVCVRACVSVCVCVCVCVCLYVYVIT